MLSTESAATFILISDLSTYQFCKSNSFSPRREEKWIFFNIVKYWPESRKHFVCNFPDVMNFKKNPLQFYQSLYRKESYDTTLAMVVAEYELCRQYCEDSNFKPIQVHILVFLQLLHIHNSHQVDPNFLLVDLIN